MGQLMTPFYILLEENTILVRTFFNVADTFGGDTNFLGTMLCEMST